MEISKLLLNSFINKMNRAQKYFLHLPKGTHFEKIIDTEYGKENIYVSPDGKKHSIPMIPDTIT